MGFYTDKQFIKYQLRFKTYILYWRCVYTGIKSIIKCIN